MTAKSDYDTTHSPALEGREAQKKELHEILLTLRAQAVELIARGDHLHAENKRLRAAIKEWAEARNRSARAMSVPPYIGRYHEAERALERIAAESDA